MTDEIKSLVASAQKIVVLQADNPDADSLGSALALEQILSELGKSVYLYCGVEIPTYLRYLEGWGRVNQDLPSQSDLSIIVDASTMSLFQNLQDSGTLGWISTKPCIVLDHHETTDNSITFASHFINEPHKSSTGEVIYDLAQKLDWPVDVTSGSLIMTAVLGDTQGLTNDLASASTYRLMADLTEIGVQRVSLEEQRRQANKFHPSILKYKATLIARSEFSSDGTVVSVTIPQAEIHEFSPLYNPGPLVQPDILNTDGVLVGIVFKAYDDGKVTAMIRCNPQAKIANLLAAEFGGGGHGFAAGFKITDGRSFNVIKSECLAKTQLLLSELDRKAA